MVISISLNEPDNVGKTTQLQLLPADFMISKVGSLHDSDEVIAELHRQDRLKDWWRDSTPTEFVTTIFGALARRHRNATAGENRDLVVFDQGTIMNEAVAVASIATKAENGDLAHARNVLDGILDEHDLRLPPEDMAILMTHGKTPDESIQIIMSRRSSPADERYHQYQELLQLELQRQELEGAYPHTIHVATSDNNGCVLPRKDSQSALPTDVA